MKKLISIILALSIAFSLVGCDSSDYKKGLELYEQGEYSNAQLIFEGLGDYKDSMQMVKACYYEKALKYAKEQDFMLALELMENASGYQDSDILIQEYKYAYAMHLVGFRDQFDYPEIQEKFDLKPLVLEFGMTEEKYEKHMTAYKMFEELYESGYGKNTEFLRDIVGICLALEVTG